MFSDGISNACCSGSAQKLELKGFSIYQREFSRAIGEDFVEQVSNAFNSSFRLVGKQCSGVFVVCLGKDRFSERQASSSHVPTTATKLEYGTSIKF